MTKRLDFPPSLREQLDEARAAATLPLARSLRRALDSIRPPRSADDVA